MCQNIETLVCNREIESLCCLRCVVIWYEHRIQLCTSFMFSVARWSHVHRSLVIMCLLFARATHEQLTVGCPLYYTFFFFSLRTGYCVTTIAAATVIVVVTTDTDTANSSLNHSSSTHTHTFHFFCAIRFLFPFTRKLIYFFFFVGI